MQSTQSNATGRTSMDPLHAATETWDRVSECTGDLVSVFDGEGRYVYASPNHATICGMDPETLLGQVPSHWIHPDDLGGVVQAIRGVLATGKHTVVEFRMRRQAATPLWLSGHVGRYETPEGDVRLITISRNVTAQREIENRLRDQEAMYRLLTEGVTDVIWTMGLDLKTRYISPAVERQLGYTAEEYRSMPLEERLPPESVARVKAAFKAELPRALELAKEGKRHSFTVEMLHRHRDGRLLWGEVSVMFLFDEGGTLVGMNGVTRNIDDRKRAEEALARSESRFRQLFERMHEGFVICQVLRDPEGRPQDIEYIEANPAFLAQTDGSIPAVKGRRASLSWAKEDLRILEEHLGDVCAGRFVRFEAFTHTFQRWYDISAWQVDGDVFAIMFEDISARRRAEQEASRNQKLESIGLLAGGIAHDFNNLLTGILGNISLARTLTSDNPRLQPMLEGAERACIRATDLTQQLLTFSRGGHPVKTDASLPELIRQAADFVLTGSSVSCTYRLSSEGLHAPVDRGQVAQVVQNLVLNAIQAMPDGGRIEIEADRVVLSEDSVSTLPAGPYVRFSVRDEGVGIPAANLEKIFDPYFTTRAGGSGLGLSVAFSIVRKHGGSITVQSTVGKGTLFTVYLPTSRDECAATGMDFVNGTALPRRARILLMDDDPSVREVIGRMLSLLGYDHASVRDGAEAVQMYARHLQLGARFDGILMDLTVPGGMGGKNAIREILEIDPEARAIVMSGYSNDPVMGSHAEHGFRDVLPKPIRLADLRDALTRLLAPRSPGPLSP